MDGWKDGSMDGWVDGWVNRQVDVYRKTSTWNSYKT